MLVAWSPVGQLQVPLQGPPLGVGPSAVGPLRPRGLCASPPTGARRHVGHDVPRGRGQRGGSVAGGARIGLTAVVQGGPHTPNSSSTPPPGSQAPVVRASLRSDMLAVLPPDLLDAVRFTGAHGGRVLLAGDMELHKKILLALVAALPYQYDWPLLIVCPAHARSTWRDEAKAWLGPTISVVSIASEADVGNIKRAPSCSVVITSYAMLDSIPRKWLDGVRVRIVDEGHHLRNARSERFRAVQELSYINRFIFVWGYPCVGVGRLGLRLPTWTRRSDRDDG